MVEKESSIIAKPQEEKEEPEQSQIYGLGGGAGNFIVVFPKKYQKIWGVSFEEHLEEMKAKDNTVSSDSPASPPSVHQSRKY